MITCILTNWGLTFLLALALTASEWLAKTDRFKENGLIDLTNHFLRTLLHKEDQK